MCYSLITTLIFFHVCLFTFGMDLVDEAKRQKKDASEKIEKKKRSIIISSSWKVWIDGIDLDYNRFDCILCEIKYSSCSVVETVFAFCVSCCLDREKKMQCIPLCIVRYASPLMEWQLFFFCMCRCDFFFVRYLSCLVHHIRPMQMK